MSEHEPQSVMPQPLTEVVVRGILENAPDGILVIDATGKIVLANIHVVEMFGYSRRELLGAHVELLVPQEKRRQHVDDRKGYFSSPRRRQMGTGLRIDGQRRDGRLIPVEISLGYIEADGGLLSLAFIREDMDRHRRAFEERIATETEGGEI